MKSNTFNYSLLAVGVAAVMGISSGANAATTTSDATPSAISNFATANYSVAGVVQPVATSNTVIVNVSETANFSLVSTVEDGAPGDDTAVNQTAVPGGTTTFTHALANTGNVSDTYTVRATGVDSALVTATPNYDLGTLTPTTISYTIVQASNGSTTLTQAQSDALNPPGSTTQALTGTLTNNATGSTIRLAPGLRANLTYIVSTPTTQNANDKGVGSLTATSTFITGQTDLATATLTNENQTIVKAPTFKIVKTATCTNAPSASSTCSSLDLNATNPQINYSITVTNVDDTANTAYKAEATNFVIRDVLPAGMTLVSPSNASSVTVTGGGGTPTVATATAGPVSGRQIIDVAVGSLAVGASRTITFTVDVSRASYTTAGSSATNNVAVYDKFIGNVGTLPTNSTPTAGTNYDIWDNTLAPTPGSEATRVPAASDASGGIGEDTAATTSFTNRKITLTGPTIREIAQTTTTDGSNTNGQVTHTAIITNNGQDAEGTTTNPLSFTIADVATAGNTLNAAVNPISRAASATAADPVAVTIVYAPPGGGSTTTATLIPTAGVYTINSTTLPVTGGIARNGIVTISYNMASTNAVVGSNESTDVTLTAGGTNPPTVPKITDTTNVKGLTLLKQAARQVNCTGNLSAYEGLIGTTATTATFTALPGDCISYKITATNTFTSTNITGVALSDLTNQWKAKAAYQSSTATATGGTGNGTVTIANPSTGITATEAVVTNLGTLAGGAAGSMTFSIKVNP